MFNSSQKNVCVCVCKSVHPSHPHTHIQLNRTDNDNNVVVSLFVSAIIISDIKSMAK